MQKLCENSLDLEGWVEESGEEKRQQKVEHRRLEAESPRSSSAFKDLGSGFYITKFDKGNAQPFTRH